MELNDVRLEIKDDLREINERVQSLEKHTIAYQVMFSEHSKHDHAMFERLNTTMEDFRDRQSDMSTHISEYNNQLKVHIAGVQELRAMNSQLTQYIQAIKNDIDKDLESFGKRIEITEAPIKWWKSTKGIIYVTWSILFAIGTAFAFYYQTWLPVRTAPKTPSTTTPITRVIK